MPTGPLGIDTVGLICGLPGLFFGIMLTGNRLSRTIQRPTRTLLPIMFKATRFLPGGSQTDRHSRHGRRAITMPSKPVKEANRSISSGKKHPNEPRLNLSLYSAKGYVSWLTKVQKARKRMRTYV